MDSKLTLIKCITLLYCESISSSRKISSSRLIQNVINVLKLPQQTGENDVNRSTIVGLKETLEWMVLEFETAEDQNAFTFNLAELLQRVRLNVGDETHVFEAFSVISDYASLQEDELNKTIKKMFKDLQTFIDQMSVREIIHKAHRDVFYNNRGVDWSQFVSNLVVDLETHKPGMNKTQKKFMLNLVSMSDPKSIKNILERAKEDTEGRGGFKTGWQAVNRMMGESGSLRRGMFVLVGALTHNYKSGFCHDLFRHFCLYNTPELDDETKKPLLLYFSAENRAEEDLMRMYVALKENETGIAVNINNVDIEEASEYISGRLQERGFHVDMLRIDPGEFSYFDLCNTVLEYEAQGYEVQSIVFDYLALCNKSGLGISGGMTGEDVRMLMQKTRVFMSARNILFVTPHQLSQQAMEKKREGVLNFLGEVAGKNYWDGSKRIANEADLEIFLDIVQNNKRSYLHIHRGKHRTVKSTAAKYKEFYLPFQEVAYVPDDIEGEDTSMESVTGANVSEIIFE